MRAFNHFVPALLAITVLAGCTAGVAPPASTYASPRAPLVLAVDEVEFVDSAAPVEGTFIDKRRSQELARKTLDFLRARVRAGGGPGLARVVVQRAELVERPRPTTGGMAGVLVREADRVLEGTLAVRISVQDWGGVERAFARAEVSRIRPVLENTTVAARDAVAQQLTNDLLAQFDEALQKSVEENLAAFLAF